MTAWLLGIAGIVVVGVVVELLLTDSPMSKFIRSIYAFFLLLVIVSPLPNILRNGVDIGSGLDYNWELVGHLNSASAQAAQRRLETSLNNFGIQNVLVTITYDRNSPSFVIQDVHINAWGVVLREDRRNINVRQEVIRIAMLTLNIREEQIRYHA